MVVFLTTVPVALVVWALVRWDKSKPKFEKPLWRSYMAFAAFWLSNSSLLLWAVLVIWALAIGRFPYYDPVPRMYAIGPLLSLAALIVSLPGKGKLRWPACGVAAWMTFLWLATATAE